MAVAGIGDVSVVPSVSSGLNSLVCRVLERGRSGEICSCLILGMGTVDFDGGIGLVTARRGGCFLRAAAVDVLTRAMRIGSGQMIM